MSGEKSTHVSKEKKKTVAELKELIDSKKTVLIASIKGLPASQFQAISKKLRGKAIVKVPKKNLIFRAIEDSGKEIARELENAIGSDVAVLFSDMDSFELAGYLLRNKTPAKAKAGQEAPMDIEVKAGMTELPPGPAISELGSVGLVTKVTNGKLEITADKIIVKKGDVIKQNVADVMSKLDIKPFSIGYIPLAAIDLVEGKFYSEISIDTEGTVAKLKEAYGKALPFAVNIAYPSKDTIKFLIGKAHSHGKALEKLSPVEEKKDEAPLEDAIENAEAKEKTEEDVKETTAEAENKDSTPEDKTEGEEK